MTVADRAWFSASRVGLERVDVGARVRELVDRNIDFVSRSLRRLGVPVADVEDATQQVFIVASRKLEKFSEEGERGYLFGIAVRVASDVRRALRRRQKAHRLLAVDFVARQSVTPESHSIQTQSRRLLDEALNALPERLRIVFVVCELEGLDRCAAAKLLGIPPGTVASRMRKAKQLFHEAAVHLQQSNQ